MSDQACFAPWPEWSASSVAAATQHAVQLEAWARQRTSEPPREVSGPTIDELGICGAGTMGTGIAAAALQHHVSVRMFDVDDSAAQRAALVLAPLQDRAAAPTPSTLRICSGPQELAACPLVLESVIEDQALKQRVLAELAASMAGEAILASNTSTIPIADLGAALPCPERFCGLHFCNPVAQRRLVEIVRTARTSSATVAAAAQFVTRIGKLPVVVQDGPGFLVNRLLLPYVNEALEMVCQGGDIRTIDRTARAFGMALGPLEMLDMMGTDVAYRAGKMMWQASPSRVSLTPILPALVKRRRLGQKTGSGFYRYPSDDAPGEFDEAIQAILEPYLRHPREFPPDEIRARLFLPMLLEAARALEEGVVVDPRDVDLAVIHGLAFPASRGGLLYWADAVGLDNIVAWMGSLESLGARMAVPALLTRLAGSGGRFYQSLA